MSKVPGPRVQGPESKLPVHGFVLAGGKSSRMGTDKALLKFRGRPLVEIAVEKLSAFCTQVSIVGEREDLGSFAPVVTGERADCGPAAGIEAGLRVAQQSWAMFVPVDVPLVPGELLQGWVEEVIGRDRSSVSHLFTASGERPAFCMLRRDCAEKVTKILDCGERKLSMVLQLAGRAEGFDAVNDRWFVNINTRQELAEAEADPLRG